MDISGLDLNLLKAFEALYIERHVTRAGMRIGLSQSAMSGALTRLRDLFSDELFIRSPAAMQPTRRAQELALPIGRALNMLRDGLGMETQEPAQFDATLTLALTDYAAFVLLPGLMARLGVQAPRLGIHVRGMFGREEALNLLDQGEADLAIGFPVEASARLVSHPLLQEGFSCVARRGHPAFDQGADLAAFIRAPHLLVSPEGDRSGLVDRMLAERGLARHVALSLPQFLVAPFVIDETDLIATLSTRVAERFAREGGGLAIFEPPLPLPQWTLSMMWHRRTDNHEALRWLRAQLVALAGTL
ncbi:LysR family transcriptional regulator [Asaia krungthepensis]|uniref:Transcriptional regulator n=1 Tax=Asaia krungthepensis NRIC 0535 TaxID=1307925 RepID=A0ABQ0Q3B9_9PROT|nr:LysR family transcriptional regulator [Asaia krungthepensis]GBQ89423.1 transcriptional regulator [Asaia krungthepensis NRIC 0535]